MTSALLNPKMMIAGIMRLTGNALLTVARRIDSGTTPSLITPSAATTEAIIRAIVNESVRNNLTAKQILRSLLGMARSLHVMAMIAKNEQKDNAHFQAECVIIANTAEAAENSAKQLLQSDFIECVRFSSTNPNT